MKIPILESLTQNKVAMFTDIHWGKSKNSEIKIKSMQEFIDNLIKSCKKNKIDNVIFLGDWFENRSAVSVKILRESYKALKKFSKAKIVLYMILGNHDTYYKDNTLINSIEHYSDIPYVHPIINMTELKFTHFNRSVILCPWNDFSTDKIPHNKDALMGHFEFSGAKLAGSVNHSGESILKLNECCPLIFSGHFHIRNEYQSQKGKIVTLGCPLQLDWGDWNDDKGFYFLDLNDMKYEYQDNPWSPKHYKLYWSKIKKRQVDLSIIKDNYIKLIIDEKYNFEHIMKIMNSLNGKNPIRPCIPEFIYNNQFNKLLNEFEGSVNFDTFNLTTMDLLKRFIDQLDKNIIQELDKTKILKMLKTYYELCKKRGINE